MYSIYSHLAIFKIYLDIKQKVFWTILIFIITFMFVFKIS